ncbi:hypothetical protein ABW19_dt0202295 [Dactylella cylindrospora]|nr:hypothetical protein ABW19_dt0202295 [Dactylella cylindrospora]
MALTVTSNMGRPKATLEKLFETRCLADVTVHPSNEHLSASRDTDGLKLHKAVLACRSRYFHELFAADPSLSRVDLPISFKTFQSIIRWIYLGEDPAFSEDSFREELLDLFDAAYDLEMHEETDGFTHALLRFASKAAIVAEEDAEFDIPYWRFLPGLLEDLQFIYEHIKMETHIHEFRELLENTTCGFQACDVLAKVGKGYWSDTFSRFVEGYLCAKMSEME